MRLLGPYIFLIIGIAIGVATTYLFKNPMRLIPNLAIGAIGSFFGLWLRDVLDIHLGGNLQGAMIAAALGALVATVGANLLYDRVFKTS